MKQQSQPNNQPTLYNSMNSYFQLKPTSKMTSSRYYHPTLAEFRHQLSHVEGG